MSATQPAKIDYRYHEPKPAFMRRMNRFYRYMSAYHDHRVEGMEKIPRKGPCLIAVNHSLATYDIGILQYKVYKAIGVHPRGFADHNFFKVPVVGRVAGYCGAIPGAHHVGEFLLREKKAHILVAPGGMRESLRPDDQKYRVLWDERKGFVRLALATRSPVILAACPAADDLYSVRENDLTKLMYKRFKLPVPLVRSAGRGVRPATIRLTHYVEGPFLPPEVPAGDEAAFDRIVDAWHAELCREMQSLMNRHTSESLKKDITHIKPDN